MPQFLCFTHLCLKLSMLGAHVGNTEMPLTAPLPRCEAEEHLLSPTTTGWNAGGCCWHQSQVRVGCLASTRPAVLQGLQAVLSCPLNAAPPASPWSLRSLLPRSAMAQLCETQEKSTEGCSPPKIDVAQELALPGGAQQQDT